MATENPTEAQTPSYAPIALDAFAARTRGSRLDIPAADALFDVIVANGGASDGVQYKAEPDARKAANKAKRLLQASPKFAKSGETARTRVGKAEGSDSILWALYFAPSEDGKKKGSKS